MQEQSCRIVGCEAPAESQGLCATHFTRALIYGQVRLPETPARHTGTARPVAAH